MSGQADRLSDREIEVQRDRERESAEQSQVAQLLFYKAIINFVIRLVK
jgi:hypothetical protein